MSQGQFSTGRDVSLDFITAAGPLRIPGLKDFSSKQDVQEKKIKLINGQTRHQRFFDGWSGSFEAERMNSAIDDYFASLEENYFAGLPETPITITETIQEPDGSVTQWRYEDVLLKLDDAGKWAGDSTISQKLSFVASRRRKVA
ncbi:hypothetical protein [Aquitalea magnusonii]|uniref:Phage tail protein n=1 Tax=Aquitalea magnusonii TaxID=332411 RepID=A0A318J117_9NEIS|nr:hypothetical protein [Aquitalea magnusonii]PXX42214.1 hypothetical protein DFR38_12011 [Aquitalea magnusonii]